MDAKKVSVLEFSTEASFTKKREIVIAKEDLLKSGDQIKLALQFVGAKYGLRNLGMSLDRVSYKSYKFGTEFNLLYLSSEKSLFFQIVVTNKKYTYLVWLEERTDIQVIQQFVKDSLNVIKREKEPSFQVIKQYVSNVNQVPEQNINVKNIEKVEENVYRYTFVN